MHLTVTFSFASNSPPVNVAQNSNDFLQADVANVTICLFHLKEELRFWALTWFKRKVLLI